MLLHGPGSGHPDSDDTEPLPAPSGIIFRAPWHAESNLGPHWTPRLPLSTADTPLRRRRLGPALSFFTVRECFHPPSDVRGFSPVGLTPGDYHVRVGGQQAGSNSPQWRVAERSWSWSWSSLSGSVGYGLAVNSTSDCGSAAGDEL